MRMFKNAILMSTLFICLLANTAWSADGEDLTSRPDAGDGPTRVQVSLYVLDIISINSANGSFDADFVLRLRWQDQRLSTSAGRRFTLNEVWNPMVGILNQRSVSKGFEETIEVREGGMVQQTQRYQGEFSAELDFRKFPFDAQYLPVKLISFGSNTEEVMLQIDSSGSIENLSASGWTLTVQEGEAGTIGANLIQGSGESILRSIASFPIRAERDVNYFRWKVLLPLTIVIFLSWAAFWIDPLQIGPQISVSATAILTLVAFLIRLDGMLPPVSYLTHMDRFVYVTLLLVFLAFIEAMAGSRLASQERGLILARRLDKWSRVLFPAAYAIVVYVFWIG